MPEGGRGLVVAQAPFFVALLGQLFQICGRRGALRLAQHIQHGRNIQVAKNLIPSQSHHGHTRELQHRLTIAFHKG